jgi:hypothetical protein
MDSRRKVAKELISKIDSQLIKLRKEKRSADSLELITLLLKIKDYIL